MDELLEAIDGRGVAVLTLNRPARRNALDEGLIARLTQSLQRLDAAADVRVVVIKGAGGNFCAGGDVEWMKRLAASSPQRNEADALVLAGLLRTLDLLSKPTIALAHGAVYGGGVGLIAACDAAIASQSATFCLSEVKLGLIPAVIGPYLVRAVGTRQARRIALTAEVVDAERAARIGLVQEVAPHEGLAAAADRVVEAILLGAPGALAETKALMHFYEGRPIDAELTRESARRLAARRASAEGREGLSAFLEKRAPAWRAAGKGGDVSKAADR